MALKHLLANAEFSVSAAKPEDLPTDHGHEVAFAGRSNAGKSSVLNKLCGRKQLARTSKTPGRTQLINFFHVSESARLVDLPGYGFAKASQHKQRQWTQLLEYYFSTRQALCGIVLVMDIRHPLREVDWTMLDWCIHYHCNVHILLNKADKLSRNQASKQLSLVMKQLPEPDKNSLSVQLFSAMAGTGLEEATNKIGDWLALK